MRKHHLCIVSMALFLAACGDDGGSGETFETLDCAWLEREDNCWRQALVEAAACTPDSFPGGTFSEDRRSCSYESGHTVELGAPAPIESDFYDWDVTVRDAAGEPCVEVVDRSSSDGFLAVTTVSGTVEMKGSPTRVQLTCPDGSRFAGEPMELLEGCFQHAPGSGASFFDGGVSYLLAGADTMVALFTCDPAAGE